MILQTILLMLLLILSLLSDIRTYRIRNIITMPFTAAGIVVNCLMHGPEGLKLAALGWLVPVLLLFALYALKMLGAGDIKLFGAIGAIAGYGFTVRSIAYSFLFGGLMAIVLLAVRKNAAVRFRYLAAYLRSCFLTFRLLDYSDFKGKDRNNRFRFTYAVLPGTLTQLLIAYIGQGM